MRVEETTELVFERVARRTRRELAGEGAGARGRLFECERLEWFPARHPHSRLGRHRRGRGYRRRDLVTGTPAIFDAPPARRGERPRVTRTELSCARVSLAWSVEPHGACRGVEGECRDGDRTAAEASTLPGGTTTRATLDHDIEGTCPMAITGGNLTAVSLNARG